MQKKDNTLLLIGLGLLLFYIIKNRTPVNTTPASHVNLMLNSSGGAVQ